MKRNLLILIAACSVVAGSAQRRVECSSADDIDNRVEIRVCVEGEEYAATSLSFASDAIYGTLENPYVIDLDATAITTVEGNGNDDDDNNWYSLQGFKLPHKPKKAGVYIHNGVKVTVK